MRLQSRFLALALYCCLVASACSAPASEEAAGPSATVAAASIPSPTATQTPTLAPTPLPPVEPISLSNLDGVQEMIAFGLGGLQGLSYNPDGTQLLIATPLGLYICNAQTLQVERVIEVENVGTTVAWSPDGRYLAYSVSIGPLGTSRDELVVYDLMSDMATSLFQGSVGDELTQITWNNASSQIAFEVEAWAYPAVGQASLIIVDVDSQDLLLNAPIFGWTTNLAWAPDDETFAASVIGNPNVNRRTPEIQIWAHESLYPVNSIPVEAAGRLAWSHNGTEIALVVGTRRFEIYDANSGELTLQTELGFEAVTPLSRSYYRPQSTWVDGDQFILLVDPQGDQWQMDSKSGELERLTDFKIGKDVFSFSLDSAVVYQLEGFLVDYVNDQTGEVSYTELFPESLKSIEASSGRDLGWVGGLEAEATFAAINRDERVLCTIKDYITYEGESLGSQIRYWGLDSGEELTLDSNPEWCDQAGGSTAIPVWEGPEGMAKQTYDHVTSRSTYGEGEMWLSPDGGTKLEVGPNGSLLVIDTTTGEAIYTLSVSGYGISLVSGSPDGSYVAAVSKDNVVKVWDLHSGELLASFGGFGYWSEAVWSPTSTGFLYTDGSGVYAFHLADGAVATLYFSTKRYVPDEWPELFRWSPSGNFVVAAVEGEGVVVLDAATGETAKVLSDAPLDWYDEIHFEWIGNGAWLLVDRSDGRLSLWGNEKP